MTLRPAHLFVALAVLAIEIIIATCVHDTFIRPTVGDFLVVVLIHFTLRAFLRISISTAAWATWLFSFAVEGTQALGLIHRLGLADNTAAKLILGNTFQWSDLVAYSLGVLCAVLLDRRISASHPPAAQGDSSGPKGL